MVRPILEYASVVCDPHHTSNIHPLEMIQHRAARYVTSNYSWRTHVTPLLEQLQWDTLLERRAKSKVIHLHKIMNNLLEINNDSEIIKSRNNRLLSIPTNVDAHRFSFLPSAIRLWNNLDVDTRNCYDHDCFKSLVTSSKIHTFGNII